MSTAMRVVLDTNVVLSALVFGGGAAARVRQGWQQGACVPLISNATAHELVRVLAYPKFRLSALEQEELLADYLPHAKAVRILQPPPVVPKCRDVFDVPFLHLALAGKARVLVSGDKDLLALAGRFAYPIVTLEAFVRDYLPAPG
jgi:putative PIN family toxin of toxin-antitoxin system